nr:hypothetical protein [Tanacetum cinerariifolium]
AVHDDQDCQCGERGAEHRQVQAGAVEQRDDGDGAEIVKNRQCSQKDFQ